MKRRDFIKGSIAALSATAVSPGEGGSDIVGIGIIGVGAQGSVLLDRLLRIDGVKVVAICDIYPPHLQKGLERARDAKGYEDYRRMLDEEKEMDAVVIATPLYLHAPMSIDAMEAGKHVFCEKTMAYSVDQAKAMARISRRTGKILQIGHQRRYNPLYNHALKLIREQKVLGRITHVRALWHRNSNWRRAVPDPKYERLLNWRLYKEYSGGLMTELGSHQIDVVNWFLDSVPISVVGVAGLDYWRDGREVWDNVGCIFEYPDGVKLFYTSITTNSYDHYYEQFMGDEGTILLLGEKEGKLIREPKAKELAWERFAKKGRTETGREGILLDAHATARERQEGETEKITGAEDAYLLELQGFVGCIRKGEKPLCDEEAGLRSAVAVLMANKAMEKGEKLTIPPDMYRI
jgi:predicted dehydrogenase